MQIVLYCIVFYNNVFRFMLLLEINFILSYITTETFVFHTNHPKLRVMSAISDI